MTNAQSSAREAPAPSHTTRWLRARTLRDFAAVEELSLQLLKKLPQHAGIRRALARTLVELDRHDDATEHWRSLCDLNPHDIEAAYHLAGANSAGKRHVFAKGSAAFREALHEVLAAHPLESVPDGDFRHIAICGVSFCGSTLMDRILGGLANVANIGESHWLTEARSSAGTEPIDFGTPGNTAIGHCSQCGPGCSILTMDFRRALAADGARWYHKIAHRLNTKELVSADKNPPKLADHDPLMRFDAVVMFKSPVQAWLSTLRRLPPDRDGDFYLRECRSYLKLWEDRYAIFLDYFAPQGKVVFLYFDEFARAPRETLEALCRALDLPFDCHVLGSIGESHSIGGNPNAVANLNAANGAVEIDKLAAPDCAQDQLRLIDETPSVQEMFDRLLCSFRRTLPA